MSEARPAPTLPATGVSRQTLRLAGRVGTPGATSPARELWLAMQLPSIPAGGLEPLARQALRFTPRVSLEPPAALLAEVRGSLRLFGGAAALRQRVLAGLQAAGQPARVAIAPTPRAALWLVRAGQDHIVLHGDLLPGLAAQLPLSCLDWPAETVATLRRFGVRNVAELVRLPRAGLARRIGPDRLRELDEGFGRCPQARRHYTAPERFTAECELPVPAVTAGALAPGVSGLLAQLEVFLRVRASGLDGLRLDLLHRGLPATRIRLGLSRPSGNPQYLGELLRERLARAALPAPVMALRLRSGVPLPLQWCSLGLFDRGHSADPEAAARLLERLRARLGQTAVFAVHAVPDHRPERAWRVAEPAVATVPASHWPAAQPPRPLWMLAVPQRLAPPDFRLIAGPERIESGWWDGHDVRRDYYVALAGDGACLWVFRERPPGQDWFLHGVFG
ncbi:MAG: DNA polymerase Y family protein [Gammaproteobacteria bacterium]|nr:DNA polymerase Y family protein [Gammaproteobacteria bacterium]